MSCTTLTAITKGCDNNIGGITAIYINDMENVSAPTVDLTNYMIDAQTASPSYETFEFRRNTGNFTEETSVDFANGSTFVTATITLMFHRREASKSKAIKILSEGQRDLAIIVKDANGKYWYFPYAQLSATAEGSGTAKADGSKYSVTFIAENENLAYEVDPAIIGGLIS
jgi:hypothetical protein